MLRALATAVAMVLAGTSAAQTLQTLDEVGPYIDHCVTERLKNQGFGPREVTLRLSFRRDGAIIGEPAVTFSRPLRGEPQQERFIAIMVEAFKSCTPLPFSTALGASIAGRPFTFRYTLTSAKDQSI